MRSAAVAVSFACIVLAPASAQAATQLAFANVFGDHMVLQREQPLRLWGTATPARTVTVRFHGQQASAAVAADGTWQLELPPFAADATGSELTATADDARTVLHDVVLGDVWLCSGQSNMAMGLEACDDAAALAAADLPAIRYRSYFEHFAGSEQRDLRERSPWRVLTPESARACTAVGFWFARAVQPIAQVPIGLLECTVGGTEIECWLPPTAFADDPVMVEAGARRAAAIAEWQRELAAALPSFEAWLARARSAAASGCAIPPPPRLRGHPNEDREHWQRTQSLWNGMVAPLTGFALRGVLWYQGESNGHEEGAYASKLRALIAGWRAAWRRELPFYFVQLPGYGAASHEPQPRDLGFAPCRMGQLQCARLPQVGMAVAIDVGDARDIHPRDKRPVGERLARFALRDQYGQSLAASGPLFANAQRDGRTLRITFDHVGRGLVAGEWRDGALVVRDAPLQGFAIAGEDRVWHHATATIDGDAVVVRADGVAAPVAVRYAYAPMPRPPLLYNRDGLPASPFRSDD